MPEHNLEVDLTLPSRFKNELIAQATLRQLAELGGYDSEEIEEMELALGEACINAIEHSKEGVIHVSMQYRPDDTLLTIIVQDQGVGFDRDSVPTPEIEKKLKSLSRRGWGIMIIENVMDEVTYSEVRPTGTKVVMKKYKVNPSESAV